MSGGLFSGPPQPRAYRQSDGRGRLAQGGVKVWIDETVSALKTKPMCLSDQRAVSTEERLGSIRHVLPSARSKIFVYFHPDVILCETPALSQWGIE
jgi:hypothetical protein